MNPPDVRDDGQVALLTGTVTDQKAYDAYQMRQRGVPWEQVCKTVGYSSVKVAQVELRRYLTDMAVRVDVEHREEVLAMEMGRLDSLMEAVWDQAMTGDTKAVDSALKIISMRAKLLGLEALTQTAGNVTNNTVVVTGNTEEFIHSLKLVDTK